MGLTRCGDSCEWTKSCCHWNSLYKSSMWNVVLLYELQSVWSNLPSMRIWYHTQNIWMVFSQHGSSCVSQGFFSNGNFFHKLSSCNVFLLNEVSCVLLKSFASGIFYHKLSNQTVSILFHLYLPRHLQVLYRDAEGLNQTEASWCPPSPNCHQTQVQSGKSSHEQPDVNDYLDQSFCLVLVLHSPLHQLLFSNVLHLWCLRFWFDEAVRTEVHHHLLHSSQWQEWMWPWYQPPPALEAALPPDGSRVPPVPL